MKDEAIQDAGGVLVTGGTGFVGRAVLRRMVADSLRPGGLRPVVAAVRGSTVQAAVSRLPDGVRQVRVGELAADTDWSACVRGVEVVIHCAARAHVMKEDVADPLAQYRTVNVQGTLALARQAAAAGVRRFVYISSIKVNGERTAPDAPFRASDPPAPEDAYGISKHEAECGLMELARTTGMEVVIIRPPLVYGPGVKGNFAIMVRWARAGIALPLGAVRNLRSLLALDNLVDFIALCADPRQSPRAANEVFLLADGEDVSTPVLLRKMAMPYHAAPRLWPLPVGWLRWAARLLGRQAVADRLLGSLVVDSSKARDLLGWRPVVSMDEQLSKMALHDDSRV